ncbi:MAG: hypothetical protein WBO49_03770 [Candidatus Saccharimonas sp.]
MNPDHNMARPLVMHIDLNSCFATVEQQARPMLRGRPVAIVNRRTEHTMIVTASYEAKAMGVKLGMRLRDAKKLCPELVGIESDPVKYRYVYHKLMAIMCDYSAHVRMKSIDEGVIDFSQAPASVLERDLVEVGYEIKRRLKEEIGCWMRCNIGISTNRFLAKMAASLHKPDGLDVLTSHNIREVFAELELQDLTGIAGRNEHRLNAVGVYTPLDMLEVDAATLHTAFQSVVGDWWYQRLRGWEVDDVEYDLKSCGRQYVLESPYLSHEEKLARLHSLVEGVGAKLRHNNKSARGVRLYARRYHGQGSWAAHELAPLPFFSNAAIWTIAKRLASGMPPDSKMIAVTCYHLHDDASDQLSLFGDELARDRHVTQAIDEINARWGERTIHSGGTVGLNDIVKTKIPFGSTRYM